MEKSSCGTITCTVNPPMRWTSKEIEKIQEERKIQEYRLSQTVSIHSLSDTNMLIIHKALSPDLSSELQPWITNWLHISTWHWTTTANLVSPRWSSWYFPWTSSTRLFPSQKNGNSILFSYPIAHCSETLVGLTFSICPESSGFSHQLCYHPDPSPYYWITAKAPLLVSILPVSPLA